MHWWKSVVKIKNEVRREVQRVNAHQQEAGITAIDKVDYKENLKEEEIKRSGGGVRTDVLKRGSSKEGPYKGQNRMNRGKEIQEGEGRADMVPAPCGLVNLGSTCYINSVLQCLWALVTRFKLLQRYSTWLKQVSGGDSLQKEFWHMMNRMSSQSEVTMFSLKKFKSVLAEGHNQFQSDHQQDAHEFLAIMLDIVKPVGKEADGTVLSVWECLSCKLRSPNSETFTCLPLDIPDVSDGGAPVELKECLEESLKTELIPERRCTVLDVAMLVPTRAWRLM